MRITDVIKHLTDITGVKYLPFHGFNYSYSSYAERGRRAHKTFYAASGLCLSFSLVCILLGILLPDIQAQSFEFFKNENWCYFKGNKTPDPNWKELDFDDSKWKSGSGGFGYGNSDGKIILNDMKGNYDSLFIRRRFRVDNLNTIKEILLHIDTDGPYVAYLNGIKVCQNICRSTAPTDITGFALELLTRGMNVLCIKGSNDALDSDDFTFKAWLEIIEE
ncbi:MAG: hypothetical protein MRK01_07710 [Candidatus Scalindua sp.]|nr:hypothetical protein [Candidatus Scalindua sp.]